MLIVALAPFADEIFDADGVEQALLAAALLPLVQVVRERRRDGTCSCTAATTCGASTRPDRPRSGFSPSSSRLPVGVDRGAPGDRPRAGDLDDRRSRRSASSRCAVPDCAAEGARRGRVARFGRSSSQSSLATGVVSLRTTLVPLILGVVSGTTRSGSSASRSTPQTGLAAASSPARLVLLTEQTRDWEKGERRGARRAAQLLEVGRRGHGRGGSRVLRRMPWLIRVVFRHGVRGRGPRPRGSFSSPPRSTSSWAGRSHSRSRSGGRDCGS